MNDREAKDAKERLRRIYCDGELPGAVYGNEKPTWEIAHAFHADHATLVKHMLGIPRRPQEDVIEDFYKGRGGGT